MAESVDALVSNTSGRKAVPVRSRLRVPCKTTSYLYSNTCGFCFIKIPDHIPDLINKHPKKMYSGMLHAHKNRPHISALRNKDNQIFIINIECPTAKNGTSGTNGTPGTSGLIKRIVFIRSLSYTVKQKNLPKSNPNRTISKSNQQKQN